MESQELPKGRRAPRKRKARGEEGLDLASRNRIRKTPSMLKFYKMVYQNHLRDEALKALIFHRIDEAEAKRLRKLLASPVAEKPVEESIAV